MFILTKYTSNSYLQQREVNTTQFLQMAPWLGVIPGTDGQVRVAEAGNSPIVDLFKSATAAIVRTPACPSPSCFLTMSKQAEAAGKICLLVTTYRASTIGLCSVR